MLPSPPPGEEGDWWKNSPLKDSRQQWKYSGLCFCIFLRTVSHHSAASFSSSSSLPFVMYIFKLLPPFAIAWGCYTFCLFLLVAGLRLQSKSSSLLPPSFFFRLAMVLYQHFPHAILTHSSGLLPSYQHYCYSWYSLPPIDLFSLLYV